MDSERRWKVEPGAGKTAACPKPAPQETLRPGEMRGPFRIVGLLGTGGMGKVYEAEDSRLGRNVALKISEERFTARFEREVRTVSALNHPNNRKGSYVPGILAAQASEATPSRSIAVLPFVNLGPEQRLRVTGDLRGRGRQWRIRIG